VGADVDHEQRATQQGFNSGNESRCLRWPLLPSTGPTMLRDTFPILLDGAAAPANPNVWESSRFALDLHPGPPKTTHCVAAATYELFAGMIEFGLSRQLSEIVTVVGAVAQDVVGTLLPAAPRLAADEDPPPIGEGALFVDGVRHTVPARRLQARNNEFSASVRLSAHFCPRPAFKPMRVCTLRIGF
jgi:hypothetical protein